MTSPIRCLYSQVPMLDIKQPQDSMKNLISDQTSIVHNSIDEPLMSSAPSSSVSSAPIHFASRDAFMAHPPIKHLIILYTKELKDSIKFKLGLPPKWEDVVPCFDEHHLPNLRLFEEMQLYVVKRIITKETFMAVYLRCTLNDIGDLLYMLYRSKLGVDGSGPDVTAIIRLSPLHRMDTPCYRIRSAASIRKEHRGFYGIGYVISDLEGSILLRKTSKCREDFGDLTKGECVVKAELHAISLALKEAITLPDVNTVRIQLDCDSAVEVLEGKAAKNSQEVMNMMCEIGKYLKFFKEYSASHLYRELNMDCDYLVNSVGGNVKDKEFHDLNKDLPRFRHCVNLKSLPKPPHPPRRMN